MRDLARIVEREWLDDLPPQNATAVRSRRDLQRLNLWLGHVGIVANALAGSFPWEAPLKLAELGSGDGSFMLRVARRLPPTWRGVRLLLVDRQPAVTKEIAQKFETLGWRLQTVTADVLHWLPREPPVDCLVANLFLHHLKRRNLDRLLSIASKKTKVFISCEPRRFWPGLVASRGLWLLGASRVTQHDAPVSVRAGFCDQELSALWPREGWRRQERAAGRFSHLFIAQKQEQNA